jgi:hypothetical protein
MLKLDQGSIFSINQNIPAWYDPDEPIRTEEGSTIGEYCYVKDNPIFKSKQFFIKKLSCAFTPLFISCDDSNENAILVGKKDFLLLSLRTLDLRRFQMPSACIFEPHFSSDKQIFIPTKKGIYLYNLEESEPKISFKNITARVKFIICSKEYYFILKNGKLFVLDVYTGEVKSLLQLSDAILFFRYIPSRKMIYGSSSNKVFCWDFYCSKFKELDLREGTNIISFGLNNSSIIVGHISGSVTFIDLLFENQRSLFVSKFPISNLSCNQNLPEFLFWNERIKGSLKMLKEDKTITIKRLSFKKISSAAISNRGTLIAASRKRELFILEGY